MITPEIEQALKEAKAKRLQTQAARADAAAVYEEAKRVHALAQTAERHAKSEWTLAWQAFYIAHNGEVVRLMKERDKHYANAQILGRDISTFWREMGEKGEALFNQETP